MTDFQMSLIAAAGVFVGGVVVYNKWQEYRARKSVERAFTSEHDDVLMRSGDSPLEGAAAERGPVERQEPVLDLGAETPLAPLDLDPGVPHDSVAPVAAAPVEPAPPSGPRTPTTIASLAPATPLPEGTPPAELAESLVDPLIDCIIPLNFEGALRGDKILPALSKLRRVGNKPIHYVGFAVSGDWEPIVHGGVYTKLQAGVQMATRTTALNEIEYSELVTRLRAVADEIGAEPEVPDMIEVMSEARTLHRFVAGHDAQLGVNLAANGAPWAISTLIQALEKQGFDVRPDGKFSMPDGQGGVLFTLSTNVTLGADTTNRLTLLLDVPCVAPSRDGFGAMVKCAKELTQRLDATIVDDFEQPLLDPALEEIKGQVAEFYEEMDASDIPAGSTRALRLFV
ncbi:cell division protein ZipA C-terminal FtsZ-binding domain-containing protein [Massilia sp. LC238]|uniref:cell division protein ZipA C-terminal FtsZ-binding domain-containing protein n=1 Tax=Massilia sp. LC238 TaxID=1502852 RepID=UPI0004E4572D|nr:cell division protein ZipA C-terminal FtsZ-binding domain-containing protein [Massilia sp. LC238]KFC75821.1 Cell division protein ZipA [Massilia sp. LC238]